MSGRAPKDGDSKMNGTNASGKDGGSDTPKLLAAMAVKVPLMVIRIGWPYLMMKRRANKCSRRLRKQLVEGGMPPHLAAKMADNYASELSVRKFLANMDFKGFRARVGGDKP